jgi:hypothetical protein
MLDEMLHCMKFILEDAMSTIGTSSELFERQNIVASMALYALYRR